MILLDKERLPPNHLFICNLYSIYSIELSKERTFSKSDVIRKGRREKGLDTVMWERARP